MSVLYLPHAKSEVQLPFLILVLFQMIISGPGLCEIFRNAVSCYDVDLAARSTTKLEDSPCRMSVTAFSVY